MTIDLSPWAKGIIVSVAVLCVISVLLLVICFLNKRCWLRKRLDRRRNDQNDFNKEDYENVQDKIISNLHQLKKGGGGGGHQQPDTNNNGKSNGSESAGKKAINSGLWLPIKKEKQTYKAISKSTQNLAEQLFKSSKSGGANRSSTCSTCSSSTCSSSQDQVCHDPLHCTNKPENFGTLTFWLHFVLNSNQHQVGRLHIGLEEAANIPSGDYLNSCDPFVVIRLTRSRWQVTKPKTNSNTKQEFRSRTVRRTRNPKFGECFSTEIPVCDLKHYTIKISIFDADRHANPTALGHLTLPLQEVPDVLTEKITLTKNFLPIKQELGDIHIGLTYLPTAQRISFSILKCNHLKYRSIVDNLQEFHPYVKVVMMKSSGRVIKKKKTAAKESSTAPVFNETMTFDLPPHLIESTAFLVMVFSKTNLLAPRNSDSSDMQSPSEMASMTSQASSSNSSQKSTSSKNGQMSIKGKGSEGRNGSQGSEAWDVVGRSENEALPRSKDLCLGKFAIGSHVRGFKERQHWFSMLNSTRKVVTEWHTLR